jgi:hypothetical protein
MGFISFQWESDELAKGKADSYKGLITYKNKS